MIKEQKSEKPLPIPFELPHNYPKEVMDDLTQNIKWRGKIKIYSKRADFKLHAAIFQLSHGVVYQKALFVVQHRVNLLIGVNNLC